MLIYHSWQIVKIQEKQRDVQLPKMLSSLLYRGRVHPKTANKTKQELGIDRPKPTLVFNSITLTIAITLVCCDKTIFSLSFPFLV